MLEDRAGGGGGSRPGSPAAAEVSGGGREGPGPARSRRGGGGEAPGRLRGPAAHGPARGGPPGGGPGPAPAAGWGRPEEGAGERPPGLGQQRVTEHSAALGAP